MGIVSFMALPCSLSIAAGDFVVKRQSPSAINSGNETKNQLNHEEHEAHEGRERQEIQASVLSRYPL